VGKFFCTDVGEHTLDAVIGHMIALLEIAGGSTHLAVGPAKLLFDIITQNHVK